MAALGLSCGMQDLCCGMQQFLKLQFLVLFCPIALLFFFRDSYYVEVPLPLFYHFLSNLFKNIFLFFT